MLSEWQTKAEIDEALIQVSLPLVTQHQLERWRGAGLLPRVEQISYAYRGSEVRYPWGTARQVVEIQSLLKIKRNLEFVGWELWWRGFPVTDEHWRPRIERSVSLYLRFLRVIDWFVDREFRDDGREDTLADRVAASAKSNFIFSRINRRVGETATVFRVLLDTLEGEFQEFDPNLHDEERSFDQTAVISAFDFAASEQHAILEQRLKFIEPLTDVLRALSRLRAAASKRDFQKLTDRELMLARDDVRRGLYIGATYYEATAWIYGNQSFGLRLLAWIAKKAGPPFKAGMIVPFALLRKSSYPLYSSEQIAQMADQAEHMLAASRRLPRLAEQNPKLKPLFTPKRLRRAFQDQYHLDLFLKAVRSVRGI